MSHNRCVLFQLLDEYATRQDIKTIVDEFNIFVVPVLNADGYAFTWSDVSGIHFRNI